MRIKITSGMLEAPVFAIFVAIIFLCHPTWNVAAGPLLCIAAAYFAFNCYGQMIRDAINGED
jgi:hypothetical protein